MFSCFLPAAVFKGCHSTGKKCTVAISFTLYGMCFLVDLLDFLSLQVTESWLAESQLCYQSGYLFKKICACVFVT